jgi:biopolymer transport protein ExbD
MEHHEGFRRLLSDEQPWLNITPLVDVVFLLLIFFLVTCKFAQDEREIHVQLPEGPSNAAAVSSQPLRVIVTRDGICRVAGKPCDDQELERRISKAAQSGQRVLVFADRSVMFSSVAKVLRISKEQGIDVPGVAVLGEQP